MNKKVLILTTVAIFALLIPSMITISPVQAKPKLYFKLYMEGVNIPGTEDRMWESHGGLHTRGQEFWILGEFYILIGEETFYPVDYSASSDFNWNYETNDGTGHLRETVTFADGSTLEILVVDKVYNVYAPDMYGEGTFVGHGTGALKGVKVAGKDSMTPAAIELGFGEVIGTGDGLEVTFTATLTNPPVPGSVSVTDGVETFSDNGDGTLTGDQTGTGTINYETGYISVTFNSAPDSATEITAGYNYIMVGGGITREGTVMGWPTP